MRESMKCSMLCVFVCSITLNVCVSAQSKQMATLYAEKSSASLALAHRATTYSALAQRGYKRWDKNYLIHIPIDIVPDKPAVTLYDKDGHVAREQAVWFQDAAQVSISDAAIAASGTLFVTGGTANQKGTIANFIAAYDSSGNTTRVVRTEPFLAMYICSAQDDGTIWAYGIDRDSEGKAERHGPMLRHYSADSEFIAGVLERATIPVDEVLLSGRYPGHVFMQCDERKVVLYQGMIDELDELELSTNKLNRIKVAPLPSEVRITGSAYIGGAILAGLHYLTKGAGLIGLFELVVGSDNVARWVAVPGTIGSKPGPGVVVRVLGSDGSSLIHTEDLTTTLHWSQVNH